MASKRRPTDKDAVEAVRLVLAGVAAGDALSAIAAKVAGLHPRNDTFPGEVFLDVGADALKLAGVTRDTPVDYEHVRALLGDIDLRGRENRKLQYALLVTAATHAGVAPDLLDEVSWWGTDDFWRYALMALVAYLHAGADRLGIPIAELCGRVAAHRQIALAGHHGAVRHHRGVPCRQGCPGIGLSGHSGRLPAAPRCNASWRSVAQTADRRRRATGIRAARPC